ncbi:acyltransferase family protein [Methylosinus sp. Ce-a6]|uniref:acyltransferase family protein n=1 Tax=Methylosinus sp. Ce-a6 TaxID=2172005 RepID=UPI00135C8C7B|nr:acyltransferase family protein [Methylosinus sp. Ce-a6]
MIYRRDIQILRGVAVLAVVMFHLDSGLVRSGFLGVDVFFVISGFLMAHLYEQGSAAEFYVRRARRLLPAYFATILATVVMSMLIVLPIEYRQVVEQSLFATAFSANIGYWLQNSYFSKAEFNPLLHLWSLAVEIQFYLLVPPLLTLARRRSLFAPLLMILSLLACMAVVTVSPKTSFFLTPLRVWQFLIGVIIAMRLETPTAMPKSLGKASASAFCLLCVISIPFLPIDGDATSMITGHPGLASVCVCLAVGGILAFGLPRMFEESSPGRALEKIGDWSYSIYLAHFPVIVLFMYLPFSGTSTGAGAGAGEMAALVGLVAGGSCLLYQVEKRNRSLFTPGRAGFAAAFIIAVAVAAGPALWLAYPIEERRIFAAWTDRAAYRCGKTFRVLHPMQDFCEITGIERRPGLMLVGNSHADSIRSSFARVAASHGYRVFFSVPNDPLVNPRFGVDWLVAKAKAEHVETVFLHFSPIDDLAGIAERVGARLEAEGIRTALLMPVPVHGAHIPAALYKNLKTGDALPEVTLDAFRERQAPLTARVRAIPSSMFRYYDLAPALCDPNCRLTDEDGHPLYFDKGHLTLTGARRLEAVFSLAIGDNKIARELGD